MKILITGGSGLLGRALLAALFAKGHRCFVLSRNPDRFRRREIFREAVWLAHDEPLPEVDAVVNLAGESIAGYWTRGKKKQILRSRIEGTKNLIEKLALLECPPRIFLSASAVGWYGDRPGELLTEDSGPDPEKNFRWRVCEAWESAARRAEIFGARVVLLRIGNVMDVRGGYLKSLLFFWRWGLGIGLGKAEAKLSWIGLADTVRLMEFALDNDEIVGPLNVVGPHPVSQREWTAAMKAGLHPWFTLRIPPWLLRLFLGEFSQAVSDSQEIIPAKAVRAGFQFLHDRVDSLFVPDYKVGGKTMEHGEGTKDS